MAVPRGHHALRPASRKTREPPPHRARVPAARVRRTLEDVAAGPTRARHRAHTTHPSASAVGSTAAASRKFAVASRSDLYYTRSFLHSPVCAIHTPRFVRSPARSRIMTPAASEKRRSACAAFPRIISARAQQSLLQEPIPVDADSNIFLAGGTFDIADPFHVAVPMSL